ncbi:MAG TPA: hypothetical protein VLX11_15865 [Candidatus Acidoferrales bacterium]|nr:hypothetical protein [Candidatus Acidoferrales bacterium]
MGLYNWRSVYAVFLALVLTAGMNACVGTLRSGANTLSNSPGTANHTPAPHQKLPGVSNFGQVTPHLFRGASPTDEGYKSLAQMGINIVVDARGDNKGRRDKVTKLGMQYVAMPWHCPFPRDATFAKFLKLIRDNQDKKIFVFCRLGSDRTGMMIAAYRMAEQGWTAREARAEMEAYGFSLGHHFICPGLAAYESRFPEEFKTSPAFKDLQPSAGTK